MESRHFSHPILERQRENHMTQVFVSIQGRLTVMRDQQGQTMAEYGVVLAVITLAVVASLMLLADGLNGRSKRSGHLLARRKRNTEGATGWAVRVRRCYAWRPSSRSWSWRSCLRAAAAQLRRNAPSSAQQRRGARRCPTLRPQHQHRGDGLVLLARARRPERRPPARDRRALLLDVRLRREGAPTRQGHRDERAASTPPAWSRTSTATSGRRSSSAATRARWRPTSSAAGASGSSRGWPASTCSGGQCPEARGLAAADLDGDGRIEVVVTTTNTSPTGSQVFVFDARGSLYRPKGAPATAWPRYNPLSRQGQRRRLQRRRQPRLRRVRGERRHRQPRRRPAARDRGHLRQPPDQRLQPRRDVGARVAVVPQSRQPPQRAAARLGPVHPLARPGGRGRATTTSMSARGPTPERRCGCNGRPRRRRSPTSTATAGTRWSACRTRS